MSGLRDLHYDDDGRCGECYEEFPCGVYTGASIVPALTKWQGEEERKKRMIRMNSQRMVTDRINELFDRLGYPLYRWTRGNSVMPVKTEMMLELLERLEKAETNARES